MTVIGITGLKGSGKDTVAKIIESNTHYSKRFSLAYTMKAVARLMFDWDKNYTDGEMKEVVDQLWGITPRQFLQQFGDFMREHIGENVPNFKVYNDNSFWCKRLMSEMYNWEDPEWTYSSYIPVAIIPDIRFPNEDQYFRRISDEYYLIKVNRCDTIYCEDNHASENQYDQLKHDFLIENNGSIEELTVKVKSILEQMGID